MKGILIALAIAFAAALAVPGARADYALPRSGATIHITGYEVLGDRVKLTLDGGSAEIAAEDLLAVETEQEYKALPANPAPSDNAAPFAKLIHSAAEKHGVDERLLRRVIAEESNYDARAVSRKRALGLMQLLPETAAHYAVTNIFDPAQNIDAGTHYLKDLLERYAGNVKLALAAYNAGPEAVDRYAGIPPYPETQQYVSRITTQLEQEKAGSPAPAQR